MNNDGLSLRDDESSYIMAGDGLLRDRSIEIDFSIKEEGSITINNENDESHLSRLLNEEKSIINNNDSLEKLSATSSSAAASAAGELVGALLLDALEGEESISGE